MTTKKDKLLETLRKNVNEWESLDKEDLLIEVMDRFLTTEQVKEIMDEQHIV